MSRDYKYIDPDDLNTEGVEVPTGTKAEVLAEGLLDVIQLSMERGWTDDDVDEALRIVSDGRAKMARARFRLILPEDK